MAKELCPYCGHTGLQQSHVAGVGGFDFSKPATHRHCPACEATVSLESARRAGSITRCAAKRLQACRRANARVGVMA